MMRKNRTGDVQASVPVKQYGGTIQESPAGYLIIYDSKHPLADVTGRVRAHRAVLYRRIGPGSHPCHWCGGDVTWDIRSGPGALEVDHVDGVRDNNDPVNLVASCHRCNFQRARGVVLTPHAVV